MAAIVIFALLRNTLTMLLRWYAAARGSAFVAIATTALRELHASGAPLIITSTRTLTSPAGGPAAGAFAGTAAAHPGGTTNSDGDTNAANNGSSPAPAAAAPRTQPQPQPQSHPRPSAPHRWYTPQSVTAPVVCCACFQPVVGAQGPEGQAQSCELCGVVAHGGCAKAVPHNCRLLALTPPEAAGAAAGGGAAVAESWQPPLPPPVQVPPPLAHDWRPAGTTLDLILPPADTEMLLGGRDGEGDPWGADPASASVAGPSPAPCHGPSSLCLYCGEPCEVGLLAVEPVWRCGACRRFTHVQCWAALHPGVLSPATLAALEGQAMEDDDTGGGGQVAEAHADRQNGPSTSTGPVAGGRTAQQETGDSGAGTGLGDGGQPNSMGSEGHRAPEAPTGRAARRRRALAAGGGGAGSAGSGAGGASSRSSAEYSRGRQASRPTGQEQQRAGSGRRAAAPAGPHTQSQAQHVDPLDRQRRCQSMSDIAAHGHVAARGGSAGSAGGGGGAAGPAGGHSQRVLHAGGAVSSSGAYEGAARWPSDAERLARLDRCNPQESLGPVGALVVPPTAVLPAHSGTAPASSPASTQAAGGGSSGSVSAPGGGPAGTTSGGAGGGKGRKKQLARALRTAQKWYRSQAAAAWSLAAPADPAGPERWRQFRVGPLPPGCRPLLVFINPRSGPQAGEHLRRQLLQLLHPMQVVDLSREAPAAALRCWWGVPGVRLLVVGGDGTAGWVLGAMEALAEQLAAERAEEEARAAVAAAEAEAQATAEREAAAAAAGGQGHADGDGEGRDGTAAAAEGGGAPVGPPAASRPPLPPLPSPPPVAVLPLGTGNDLARVLGWGGGLAALEARGGVAAVLAEAAGAAAALLDRWALGIAPEPKEPVKRRTSFLPRRRTAPPPVVKTPAPVTEVKVFNNYLGVGIDSWCALEFHRMRERYPGWFRSQLGNKMWYTGVGARDLLARSCVDLPSRLQLVCDGVPVELPPGTQGILLLSIPSYMGGVDLWGHGLPASHLPGPQHGGPQAAALPPVAEQWEGAGGPGGIRAGGRGVSGGAAGNGSPERPAVPASASAGGTSPSGAAAASSRTHAPAEAAQAQPSAPLAGPALHAVGAGMAPAVSTATAGPAGPIWPNASIPQSMCDGVMEVVAVYGAVHLGQLQVGLARATRLCQCRCATITTRQALPMQVDGEPWMQPPAQLTVRLKGRSCVLRRLDLSSASARMAAAVGQVLDGAVARGTISAAQRAALEAELAHKLGAPHTL